MSHSDRQWQKIGREEPYFGVLVEPRYRRAVMDAAGREAFFASGEEHVQRVWGWLAEVGVGPKRVLDFGCGVGRVLLPMAGRCERAVGVDVSTGMLEEAARNASALGLVNVELAGSLSGVAGRFDLVHSHIVLQHIPVSVGMGYITGLAERVDAGGAAVVQVCTSCGLPAWRQTAAALRARAAPVRWLVDAVRGKRGQPVMQMHVYNAASVEAALTGAGLEVVRREPTRHGAYGGLVFVAVRAAA